MPVRCSLCDRSRLAEAIQKESANEFPSMKLANRTGLIEENYQVKVPRNAVEEAKVSDQLVWETHFDPNLITESPTPFPVMGEESHERLVLE